MLYYCQFVRLVFQMCEERYERTINYAMINPSPHLSHGNGMESKNKNDMSRCMRYGLKSCTRKLRHENFCVGGSFNTTW